MFYGKKNYFCSGTLVNWFLVGYVTKFRYFTENFCSERQLVRILDEYFLGTKQSNIIVEYENCLYNFSEKRYILYHIIRKINFGITICTLIPFNKC